MSRGTLASWRKALPCRVPATAPAEALQGERVGPRSAWGARVMTATLRGEAEERP